MWPWITIPGTNETLPTYHLVHAVGWLTFLIVGLATTRNRPDLKHHWWWLYAFLMASDTVGANLLARFVQGRHQGYWGGPLLFAAVTIAYAAVRRVRASPFLDAWAIAFSAAHVFEKGGCLAAGCCFGRRTDSSWGMALGSSPGGVEIRWIALPLYEASLHGLTTIVLASLYARGRLKGRLILLLGVIYATWRAVVEPFRVVPASNLPGIPISSINAVCFLVLGFSLACLLLGWVVDKRGAIHPPQP